MIAYERLDKMLIGYLHFEEKVSGLSDECWALVRLVEEEEQLFELSNDDGVSPQQVEDFVKNRVIPFLLNGSSKEIT